VKLEANWSWSFAWWQSNGGDCAAVFESDGGDSVFSISW